MTSYSDSPNWTFDCDPSRHAGWCPTQVTASSSSPRASTLRWIRPIWACFS